MLFRLKFSHFFALFLAFFAAHTTFSSKQPEFVDPRPSFILQNKSGYDIFCRDRSIAEVEAGLWTGGSDFIIKPGDSIKLNGSRNYSIRTAGQKSMLSHYYDVPTPYTLARSTLNPKQFHQFDLALRRTKPCISVISISSGLTYGWNFSIGYTCQ